MNATVWPLVISLTSAHFLGDFVLQTDNDVKQKAQLKAGAFCKHSLIIAALSYLLCGVWRSWQIPLFFFVGHFTIDVLKEASTQRWFVERHERLKPIGKVWVFIFDQSLHLAVVAAVAFYLPRLGMAPSDLFWENLWGSPWLHLLVLVTGAVWAIRVGGFLIGILVEPLLSQLCTDRDAQGQKPLQRGFENGGRIIGQLERSLIFLFVLTGMPAGVGFLVAAKSIFRFGELKEHSQRMEAEYIIIGTLMSFGWALLASWFTQRILKLV
jgi:hypothetical protein